MHESIVVFNDKPLYDRRHECTRVPFRSCLSIPNPTGGSSMQKPGSEIELETNRASERRIGTESRKQRESISVVTD